jgi:TonB family protein
VNIFLLMLFVGSMFVVGASNRIGGDEAFADELNDDKARLTKLIVKPPEVQRNRFLDQLNQQKAAHEPKPVAQASNGEKKPPPKTPKPASHSGDTNPKAKAQNLVKNLFSGPGSSVASIFSGPGLSKDLKGAISNVTASAGPGNGIDGLVTKTGPGGPSGGSSIGLGPIATNGRDTGYDKKGGNLTGKVSVDPAIAATDFKINEGTLDKELVRKVIQENKGQIRACFESLLNQYPDLNGKVQAQFTIGPAGQVLESKVAQSTTGSRELDVCVANHVRLWQFPKPKGGGVVVVSYPFLFKQAGSRN